MGGSGESLLRHAHKGKPNCARRGRARLPALAAAVVGALIVGKGIAAAVAARAFNYNRAAQMTMWSLTLPQVAATLAATLVGFDTVGPAGQRLIDERILDVVFVLILVTATLGPIMTQRYAPLMLESSGPSARRKSA